MRQTVSLKKTKGQIMKYRFLLNIAAALSAVVMLCGCACKVNMEEVLQLPQNSSISTRYHLWYTDPENISPLNYQEGQFLPAGTVIEPVSIERGSYDIWGSVSVVDGSIRFRTPSDGKEYTIKYDQRLTMISIEDFIRQLFTIEPADNVYKNIPEDELDRVKAGKIEKNMHAASVLVVLGPPAKSRTSQITNQSWLYWKNQDVVFRLIFRGDKIRSIGSLDDLGF